MMASYDSQVETITPLDLRRSLGRILDEASAGRRFLIERDHRPLAVLIPVEDVARLEESAEDAARRQREAWDGSGTTRAGSVRTWTRTARAWRSWCARTGTARDRRDRRRAAGDLGASIAYDDE